MIVKEREGRLYYLVKRFSSDRPTNPLALDAVYIPLEFIWPFRYFTFDLFMIILLQLPPVAHKLSDTQNWWIDDI